MTTALAVTRPTRPTRTTQPAHRPARRTDAEPRLLLPPLPEPERSAVETIAAAVPASLRSVRSPLDGAPARPAEPAVTPPDAPDACATAGPLVLAVQEVLSGSRSPAQLTRWVTPELYEHLVGMLPLRRASTPRRRGRVLSVRACEVGTGVCEMTVVIHDGDRVRAAAARLELHRGRWRATALQIG